MLEFDSDEARAEWLASMESNLAQLEARSDDTGKRRASEVRAEIAAATGKGAGKQTRSGSSDAPRATRDAPPSDRPSS